MVAAGVAVGVGAATCFETAYLLQALEARTVAADRRAGGVLLALARRRRWLAGLALAAAGAVLQIVALRLAPLTVVQPALALGVVALVGIGGIVLGEPVTRADLAAAAVLAAGVAALGVASSGLESAPPSGVATALVLVALAAPVVTALVLRRAPPLLLLAAAGMGDAIAAIAAKRLADALGAHAGAAAAAWLVLAAAAVAGALAGEMAALRHWPATRVGPFVLVCQTALPVLLAPVVAGERWGGQAPLVLLGLALVVGGGARLAASAGLLEHGKALEQDGRGVG